MCGEKKNMQSGGRRLYFLLGRENTFCIQTHNEVVEQGEVTGAGAV